MAYGLGRGARILVSAPSTPRYAFSAIPRWRRAAAIRTRTTRVARLASLATRWLSRSPTALRFSRRAELRAEAMGRRRLSSALERSPHWRAAGAFGPMENHTSSVFNEQCEHLGDRRESNPLPTRHERVPSRSASATAQDREAGLTPGLSAFEANESAGETLR